jgi:Rrf2 family protein
MVSAGLGRRVLPEIDLCFASLLTELSTCCCNGDHLMFSVTAQYAVRALAHLAAQPRDVMVGGEKLSQETGIPKNYLSKILLVLGNAGIIEAIRGNAGGYRLAFAPESIPLVRIVELFERHVAKRDCLLGLRQNCSDEDPCMAHHAWRPAKEAYFSFLEETTLSDISSDGEPGKSGARAQRRRNRPKSR